MNARTGKLMATIGVALAGVGFIVYSALSNSQPTQDVDDIVAQWKASGDSRGKMLHKGMGLHGYVEAGSIKSDVVGQKTKREFVLTLNDGRMKVRHEGPVPDTFREGAEVVARGKLVQDAGGELVFEARELMAKCPSKYEGGGPQGYKGGGEKPLFD
ncbi:MAG TPA: cytochrome c maturation protein CcmE [Kofleriaceae bacterium]|jgi:cytochrome c-type biogenesis protein CcmE|nr:cytochrome c maturation protein CcmE [Kofleriaceae bacterium]